MWSSNSLLRSCERLKALGFAREFENGMRVARGFADLGYEEFFFLSGRKIVSIFSGQSSPFPTEHEKFFFWVPPIDVLMEAISLRGFDIENIQYPMQREWVVRARHVESGAQIETRNAELHTATADCLAAIWEQEQ